MVDDSPPPDSPGDDFEDANASVLYARLTLVPSQGENGQQQEVETGGQTQFDVYGGENRIGRDPDECNIVIHNKVRHFVA